MSELFKTRFRGYLIDHHSPAEPAVDLKNLDIAEYEAFFEKANISTLMVYTKDHWGYSYYNTKIGRRHPALKLDFVGEIARVLKKRDIEFQAYYCLEYDTLAPQLNPDWSLQDCRGRPVRLKGRMAKWGMACYETGYRDYVLGQLEEVVTAYRPDSLFLDIFGKSLCYCPSCRQKFLSAYGYPLPESDWEPQDEMGAFDFGEKGRDVAAFLADSAAGMLREISARLKAIDPALKITVNFSALYPKEIRDMLDYQFTEPWAGNWLSAAYSRDTAKGQYPQLGPGDVSEVYNYRPDTVYQLAAHQIAAQGCRVFFYSGSQHVDGTLEHAEAEKLGQAYSQVARYEGYLSGRHVLADVAILQSDAASVAGSGHRVVGNAIGRCKKSDRHRAAVLGAMRFCDYAKYSWQIIPSQELSPQRAKAFRCIILAGVFYLDENLCSTLEEFVQAGGVLIADGRCGLANRDGSPRADFALQALFGCRYQGELKDYDSAPWGGYIAADKNPLWRHLPPTSPPMGPRQILVSCTTGKPLGTLISPSVRLSETQWVNWWSPPPQSAAGPLPMVVQNSFGKGNCLYFAFDYFTETDHNLWPGLLCGALEMLVPDPALRLETDIPETVGFVAYRRPGQLIVHSLSHLAERMNGDCPPVPGGTLRLGKSLGPIRGARLVYPNECALSLQGDKLPLPPVSQHQIIVLDMGA